MTKSQEAAKGMNADSAARGALRAARTELACSGTPLTRADSFTIFTYYK